MNKSYRPAYHASVPSGWANDPNGTIWYGGRAHLFYQHYPHRPSWGTMHWGHMSTRDFLHWQQHPVALIPDRDYELLCGCCSGSALELDGQLTLMYTAAQPWLQRQCLARSEDGGEHFIKDPENPILAAADLDPEISPLDFRDPRLFRRGDWYYLLAGVRIITPAQREKLEKWTKVLEEANQGATLSSEIQSPSDTLRSPSAGSTDEADLELLGRGNLALARSRDLRHWEYVGHLLHPQPELPELNAAFFALNGAYECPDYLTVDGRELLLSSPQNLHRQGDRYQNLHSGTWMMGKLDFDTGAFHVDSMGELDKGFDFYAAQTLRTPDGRAVLIAWKEMWDRSFPTRDEGWAGTYNLPRELRVEGNRLYQAPVREIETIRGAGTRQDAFPVAEGETGFQGIRGGCCELLVSLLPGSAQRAGLKLFQGAEHETLLYYDRAKGCLVLDRSRSGLPITGREADVNRRFCPVANPEAISLRIFLDRSCLEVFVEEGREVLTANVYPDPEDEGISFFAQGGSAQFRDLVHYELKP